MLSWLAKLQLAKKSGGDNLVAPGMGNTNHNLKGKPMTQLITKIKFINKAKTEIELVDKETGDNSVTTKATKYLSDDLRHPDFSNIGNEIMPYIKKIFKIDKDRDLEFKALHLQRDDHNGIQVTVFERFDGFAGGCAFTYPTLVEADSAKTNLNKIPAQLQDAIDKLIEEAHKYMGGKRSQGALPLEDGEEEDGENEEEENTNQVVKMGKRR